MVDGNGRQLGVASPLSGSHHSARRTSSFTKGIQVAFLIVAWYTLSTLITLFNQLLLSDKHGLLKDHSEGGDAQDHKKKHNGLPTPFLTASVQFLVQWLACQVVLATCKKRTTTDDQSVRDYLILVVGNGACTALDIMLSLYSQRSLHVSFITMIKGTVPLWLLLFSFLFGLERITWRLIGIVAVICVGLGLLVEGEGNFNVWGFLSIMTASVCAGLRWTTTQILLKGKSAHDAMGSPIEVLDALTPTMYTTAAILSASVEIVPNLSQLHDSPYFESPSRVLISFLTVATIGLLAFVMIWTEFQVLRLTSALTLIIAGTFKEVVTIIASMVWPGDKLSGLNYVGLVVIFIGAGLYNQYRYQQTVAGGGDSTAMFEADKIELISSVDVDATNGKSAVSPISDNMSPGSMRHRQNGESRIGGTVQVQMSPVDSSGVQEGEVAK